MQRRDLHGAAAEARARPDPEALPPPGRITLGTQVYDALRDLLIAGELAPGERLSLRTVAERLGTSMMPAREAVSRLVADEALEVLPNRAVRVPVITLKKFRELTRVRIAVEGFAAAEAAQACGPGDLAAIRAHDAAFRSEVRADAPDLERAMRANRDLHFAVYAAAACPRSSRSSRGCGCASARCSTSTCAPRPAASPRAGPRRTTRASWRPSRRETPRAPAPRSPPTSPAAPPSSKRPVAWPPEPGAPQRRIIMEMGLGGLKVLVTAGAGGIGLEVAQAFREEGARVHVCDVDRDALAALPTGITGTHADVAAREDVARLFADADAALGGLDCLVNNAGIAGPTGRVEEINPEDWDRTLDICITGQFNCVRLAVPQLRRSANPSIVNLSSAAGRFGFPLRTPYAAAKWAVIGFTKSLSRELGPDGIRVNAVLPGIVAGDRQRRVLEAKAQQRGISFSEMESAAFAAASIKDYVTARQLADQILFLASARGKTISGQALAVDGDLQMLT